MGETKATIFEIKHFAVHDGDGIRTTVFFKGCPLKCVWCHNPEGLTARPQLALYSGKCVGCRSCEAACPNGAHLFPGEGIHTVDRERCAACGACVGVCDSEALTLYGREVTVAELLPELLEDRDFYESSAGGVTVSGGECLSQHKFVLELLQALKKEGINTAVDTSGFVSRDVLRSVIPYTDIFLYDVKAFDSDVHEKCTGQPNGLILDNLRYLSEVGAPVEIRIPYVPGYNDGEIGKIGRFLSEMKNVVKVRVLPYHFYAKSKYAAVGVPDTLPPRMPDDAEMKAARDVIRGFGLRVVE